MVIAKEFVVAVRLTELAMPHADHAAAQLASYGRAHQDTKSQTMTTSFGVPMPTRTASLTAGERGPLLLQDIHFLDELQHFDRERIPERVVHAKGSGAHGYLEITHDITKYSRACVFERVGKRTPLFIRFSTVGKMMSYPHFNMQYVCRT